MLRGERILSGYPPPCAPWLSVSETIAARNLWPRALTHDDTSSASRPREQEAGRFGDGGDFSAGLGRLPLHVIRSYAYAQTGEIEAMHTDGAQGLGWWRRGGAAVCGH